MKFDGPALFQARSSWAGAALAELLGERTDQSERRPAAWLDGLPTLGPETATFAEPLGRQPDGR